MRRLCAVQLASAKTAECRAKVDLKLHFCPATLDEPVRTCCCWCLLTAAYTFQHLLLSLCDLSRLSFRAQDKRYGRTRRELLQEEYVEGSKHGGIGQPQHGFSVGGDVAKHKGHGDCCADLLTAA